MLSVELSVLRTTLLFAVVAIYAVNAVPKPFSCMSYMEDDKFLQDDYDSNSEETVSSMDETKEIGNAIATASHAQKSILNLSASTGAQRRICQPDYTFCFSLWRQNANGIKIEKQGCWKESTERNATCNQHECTSSAPTSRNNTLYYCCCSGEACNEHVSVVEPAPLQLSKDITFSSNGNSVNQRRGSVWSGVFLFCALAVFGITVGMVATYLYRHKMLQKSAPEEAPLAPSGPGYSSNLRNVDNINLICMLGSGKFGTVMKGVLHDQEVAVKIYPEGHHQYYINERNIYTLPLMDCPALLTYLGYDERQTIDGQMEFQLVLSLAPLGCLQDYISANTLDFETFCGMAKSITRGVSYLHTEIRSGEAFKPCVVHRDLNSRNVLIKADRTCCVADFGFALKVFGAKYEYKGEVSIAETKSINEVGTLRYMAPELLEGAVNLRDCETSLKQMDVYALSLVLWEVATRCADFYPSAQLIPPYKAPYEAEVGTHPTFDLMQTYVVRRKARPLFPNGWSSGAAAKLIKDTCEDCWDHDAEARLTSLCAEERMHEVASLRPRLQLHSHTASPTLSANNLVGTRVVKQFTEAEQGRNRVDVYSNGIGVAVETVPDTQATASATAAILQPPPNQQITSFSREVLAEKNHLMCTQLQLQPYHGRNPCQERNLAPVTVRSPQRLVQKSKKHSFQSNEEHSFSCIEDDVSVEELFAGVGSGSKEVAAAKAANLGQGFPKQQNTDRALRGWHGVRALIQKKLFRADGHDGEGALWQPNLFNNPIGAAGVEEKSNLVESRAAAVVNKLQDEVDGPFRAGRTVSSVSRIQQPPILLAMDIRSNSLDAHSRRPNNLDLSPMAITLDIHDLHASPTLGLNNTPLSHSAMPIKSIHPIAEEHNESEPPETATEEYPMGSAKRPTLSSLETRIATPVHNMPPRSLSACPIRNSKTIDNCTTSDNNNIPAHYYNNNNYIWKADSKDDRIGGHSFSDGKFETNDQTHPRQLQLQSQQHFKRQRSLEVFREVFSGRGSTERLRDPSQRVKTPGDVPPSVRKVRASKTLSLYDDRMMDSSTLNIL